MGSPLGLVLAGIFMVEFERIRQLTLKEHKNPWNSHVDDTIFQIHKRRIYFTNEIEKKDKLPFLNVLLMRNVKITKMKQQNKVKVSTMICICIDRQIDRQINFFFRN